MDFKKLRELVEANIYLDLKTASLKELRVNYDPGDDNAWFVIAPEKFMKIEDLAAIINAKAQIKLHSKTTTPFGNKKS